MHVDATPQSATLAGRIADRSARVCVVGLGYVGLPTAVAFADAGFQVVGVDVDADRCCDVNNGRSYVEGVDTAALPRAVRNGRLRAVARLSEAGTPDVIDVCVPTPLDKSRDPDMSAILAVVEELQAVSSEAQLVVLTSTTYPGTTTELLGPVLEQDGRTIGSDVFLAFAPERIDPGNPEFGIRNTPKVVGGVTPECTRLAKLLFETIVDTVISVSSPAAAEMTKLLENTFRSVNIALANEVAIMCRRVGVDVWEVMEAAATKPYGYMSFHPGPGLGGHCIPIDPTYLSWKLRSLDYVARFIGLAEDINRHMPDYVVGRAVDILNEASRSLKGAKVLLLGVAYKPNVGDLRESPSIDLLSQLRRRGAVMSYSDPHVPGPIDVDGNQMAGEDVTADLLSKQDLVIVTTDHAAFDWEVVRQHARAVLDTRGVAHRLGIRGWHSL